MSALVFGIMKNKNVSRSTTSNSENKMRYVLVNEDNGARFNGKNYNLGRDFITLASHDSKHSWTTASLDEAKNGLNNGAYDVEVIIPEKFSRDILSLENANPKKAGIIYHVRKGKNEITNLSIERNVDAIVTYFNNRVVRMYFSSLIGNLRNAQINAQTMANNQSSLIKNLDTQVQNPFSDLNNQLESVYQTASILTDDYNVSQTDFANSIKEMMSALDAQRKAMEADQISKDESQKASINELKDKLQKQLDALESSQDKVEDLANFKDMTQSFTTLKKQTKDLPDLLKEIEEQRTALKQLKDELEKVYSIKSDASIEDNAKAIENYLSPTVNNEQLLVNFNQTVVNQIRNLPVYTDLSKDNAMSELWGDNSKKEYENSVAILQAFAQEQGIKFGESQKKLVTNSDNKQSSAKVTLKFNPGSNNVVFSAGKNIQIKDVGTLDVQDSDYQVTKKDDNKDHFTVLVEPKDPKKELEPHSVAATFEVTYDYSLDGSTDYSWKVNDQEQVSGQFVNKKDLDLRDVNDNIKNTIVAAQEVAAVYGNSQANTVDNFVDHLDHGKLVKLDNSLAKAVSPGISANNTPLNKRAEALAKYYEKINEQISVLNQAVGKEPIKMKKKIGHLEKLDQVLNEDAISNYLNQSSKILKWYLDAKKAIKDVSISADQNIKEVASQVQDSQEAPSSNNLAEQAQEIKKSINEDASNLAVTEKPESKAKTANPKMSNLAKTTQDLRKHTNDIMSGLNSGVKQGKKDANNNQNYANAFNQVMANARNGESDNNRVYNFLSNPIRTQGFYSKDRQKSILPYFMVLIGTLVALFVGLGINKYLPDRKLNEDNSLKKQTRVFFNLPALVTTLGLSIVLGLIFALSTMSLIPETSKGNWILYTTLVITILTSAVAIGSKHFKNVTIFVVALLLGFYLMLTPFLGIITRTASLIRDLYILSPLQNIEAGYTVISNGSMIGNYSLGILFILLILVIVWGLFSKNDRFSLIKQEQEDGEY